MYKPTRVLTIVNGNKGRPLILIRHICIAYQWPVNSCTTMLIVPTVWSA